MAGSTKALKRDASGQVGPQIYDAVADDYQYAKGTDGNQHAIIVDSAGAEVDLSALLGAIQTATEAAQAATVATQAATEASKTALEGTLTAQLSGSKAQVGSQRFTSLAAAQAFTVPSGATIARVYCEVGEVRVRDDGSTATITSGIIIGEGTYEVIYSPAAGSVIETVAGSIVTVVYY